MTGDEPHHRFLHVGFDVFSGLLLGISADFADHDNRVRVRIGVEHFDSVEEAGADNGIAADADAGRLPYAQPRELIDSFVSQSPAAADHPDVAFFMYAARHDADLALAGRDDARTVRSDEPSLGEVDGVCRAHHVNHRNAFGDADDERELGVGGFEDGVGGIRRRNKNHRRVRAGSFHRVGHGIKHGSLEML